MRVSEAALALITRLNLKGDAEYLTQWNDNWQAYSLIGGHREPGESFRDCCAREVIEELECITDDLKVSLSPYVTLRFHEYSRAAKCHTDYQWQVFIVVISDIVINRLPVSCCWVTRDLIRARNADDGRPIADQVARILKAVDEAPPAVSSG